MKIPSQVLLGLALMAPGFILATLVGGWKFIIMMVLIGATLSFIAGCVAIFAYFDED